MDVFLRQGILSEREMVARQEILLENYARTLMIEGHVMADMVRSLVLPPAREEETKAASVLIAVKSAGGDDSAERNTSTI